MTSPAVVAAIVTARRHWHCCNLPPHFQIRWDARPHSAEQLAIMKVFLEAKQRERKWDRINRGGLILMVLLSLTIFFDPSLGIVIAFIPMLFGMLGLLGFVSSLSREVHNLLHVLNDYGLLVARAKGR